MQVLTVLDSTRSVCSTRSRTQNPEVPRIKTISLLYLSLTACSVHATHVENRPATPVIETRDVERFYGVYDAADGHPTSEALQQDYLDPGSDGLHVLARLRRVNGESIASAIAKRPQIYTNARACVKVLPAVRDRLADAMRDLGQRYPEARFPPITIAIGRGKPVGVGGRETGVQIGLEALCATDWVDPDVEDRFVRVIVHEYVHVQQAVAFSEGEHPTVLGASLEEGAAEFVTKLITGAAAYAYMPALVKGHEVEIESAFAADLDKSDLSDWLYNSTPERPADLGYWVGYRIVKTYYRNASDKNQALRDIFGMTDPKAFLKASGWRPGIEPP
ncbi:DUF2268 domain-containing putative Zn-dependent protease [Dokdonella immobilis]|uniref:Predicted Zn-dependent protease n=1 Tax=Dokdonella immobilis TaxID=578942 RepID=A0A1I5B8E8_9GAMM|nr:DUF2268 domain-containing putative Zn-dependent protease [Dokdonella immobilis]SFN70983.1 Predicted Zn-dependent protease [Dokdonella immobilis]